MKHRAYYLRYMLSPEWKALRQKRLERDGYQCQHCGHKRHLEIHHTTYARLGRERLSDLLTLCHFCHSDHHAAQKHRRPHSIAVN